MKHALLWLVPPATALVALLANGGCSATGDTGTGGSGAAAASGGAAGSAAGSAGASSGGASGAGATGSGGAAGATGSGGATASCLQGSPDQSGCNCSSPTTTQACYPATASPTTRGVGVCKDGTQTCNGTPEFATWSACTGAVTPSAENCSNGLDDDCSGLADCLDPACAADPKCGGSCTNGATRPCYDGPPGTLNVGTCKAGTQTCSGGQWSTTCAGETLPAAEVCTDTLDHNCNGFKGCDDIFLCALNTTCWGSCTSPDPSCVCPVGTGDAATCPKGMFGKVKTLGFGTGKPPEVECCPCTANDCGNRGCCASSACSGNQLCGNSNCHGLASSCGGKVNFDCDFEDYDPNDSSKIPEDCDQPCCECTPGC